MNYSIRKVTRSQARTDEFRLAGRSKRESSDRTAPIKGRGPPMLKRLARTCYRRRWRVLAAWVVFLVAVSVISSTAGGVFRNEFSLAGSDSKEASDFLEERGFPSRAGFSGQIVFASDKGVENPNVRGAMEGLFARVERTVPRTDVVSPYQAGEARQISEDGRIAYAEVNLADRPDADFRSAADEIKAEAEDVKVSGLQV